jgi:hypothetical protein
MGGIPPDYYHLASFYLYGLNHRVPEHGARRPLILFPCVLTQRFGGKNGKRC